MTNSAAKFPKYSEELSSEPAEDLIEISEEQYFELQNKLEKLKKLFNSGHLGSIDKKQLSFLSLYDNEQKS